MKRSPEAFTGAFRAGRARFEWGFTTRRFPLVVKNCAEFRLAKSFPVSFGIQVHSNRVATARGLRCFEATDGVATQVPNLRVAALSADCLPILIAAPGKKPAVAAVHAGWKGTEKRIAARAVKRLAKLSGADPKTFRAILGPALRECCYEVGPEFLEKFPLSTRRVRGGWRFDLASENRRQLELAGIPAKAIQDTGFCTLCRPKLFYSWRGEKERAARLISWISFSLQPAS